MDKASLHTFIPLSNADASSSTCNPSPSTSQTASCDSRQRHPNDRTRDISATFFKRQRLSKTITKHAHRSFDKARAKSDGNKPCIWCDTNDNTLPCIHGVQNNNDIQHLLKQIHDLSAKNKLTDSILAALQSNDETSTEVLRAVRNGDSCESIAERLGLAHAKQEQMPTPTDAEQSCEDSSHGDESPQLDSPWTNVTRDSAVLDHLFLLYFAWVHPVYTLFSEGHFAKSYKTQTRQHCSSLLVNAICAMACHFHTPSEDVELDYNRLGVCFAEAFRADFDPTDDSITSIQAMAVMFLVDLARGFGLRASSYLRLASEKIAEASATMSEMPYSLKNTIHGIRCLNIEWAQVTFQTPTLLRFCPVETSSEDEASLDDMPWYLYRYKDDQCPAWPSLLATTNQQKMKLMSIIGDATTVMYGSYRNVITARQILELYGRFTTWRAALPHFIADIAPNGQVLPHVLSLLFLYDYSVVQLLQPLIEHDGFSSAIVEEVIWTHAQHALFLLERHYRPRYTCRYQPVLQMFAISSICDLIVRHFPTKSGNDPAIKNGPEAITLGLEVLQESYIGFPAAGAIREMLRRAAVGYAVRLPKTLDQDQEPPRDLQSAYSYDDFIDFCTRTSYLQPSWSVRAKFGKGFAEDWYAKGPEYGFENPKLSSRNPRVSTIELQKKAHTLMQIKSLLNAN